MTTAEPIILHRCGPAIPQGEHGGTLGASVIRYPGSMRPIVTLDSTDGDGGPPNLWFELTPDAAVELAELLLHHAEVALDFQAGVN
jgi:hypothetical protein